MSNNICNKLEKLSPPSFVTTGSSNRRSVILSWSTLVLKSKYGTLKDLLNSEITLLSGYIYRKGTQLRLEKALMLTRQIQKVSQRWRLNDFYSQLKQFENSMGIFDDKTGCLIKPDSSSSKREERLPSSQWLNWVLYLALRDSALLAKVIIECENTIKFWLGLIASSHHWGDSLVICGILSRVWFLCSNLLQDLIQIIYPTLLQVSSSLKPNRSGNWPDTKFVAPSDLYKWILHDMKLPYRPADFTTMDFVVSTPRKNTPTSRINFSFLSKYFQKDEENGSNDEIDVEESFQMHSSEALEEQPRSSEHETQVNLNRKNDDDEDLGMVVERTISQTSKKKRKLEKKKTNNLVIEKKKKKKRAKDDAAQEDLGMVAEQSISQTPPKKKQKLQKKKINNRVIEKTKKKKKKIAT